MGARNHSDDRHCAESVLEPFSTMVATLTKSSKPKSDALSAEAIAQQDEEQHSNHEFSPECDASTLSDANIALASAWLKTCSETHTACRDAISASYLPTRLINIVNPSHPFLEDNEVVSIRSYATLSYVWGNVTKRYVTNSGNFEQHYNSIPRCDLPKTFQEAIDLASRLGFKHIWIDALTIIQDSVEDSRTEIARMGDVYKQSALTIFAGAGDNVDAGLSMTRDPRLTKPCQLDFAATIGDETHQISAYVQSLPERSPCPLDTRGWILQEEVLAPRQLVFRHSEMQWTCRSCELSESMPTTHAASPDTLDDVKKGLVGRKPEMVTTYLPLLHFWLDSTNAPEVSLHATKGLFETWYRVVEAFSRRSLSYSSDVLPALAGLATIFAANHHIFYLNGIWKEDFTSGLLWAVRSSRKDKHPGPQVQDSVTRLSLCSISWSWVSQWGENIKFEPNKKGKQTHVLYSIKVDAITSDENSEYVQPTMDMQGIVNKSLTLYGRCIDLEIGTVLVTKERKMLWQKSRHTAFHYNNYLEMDYSKRARPVVESKRQTAYGWLLLDSSLVDTPTNNIKFCLCKVLDSGNRSKNTEESHSRTSQVGSMLHKSILSNPRLRKAKARIEESTQRPGPAEKVQACFTLLGLALVPTDSDGHYRRVGLLKTCIHFDEEITKVPNFAPLEHLPHPWHHAQGETFTLV